MLLPYNTPNEEVRISSIEYSCEFNAKIQRNFKGIIVIVANYRNKSGEFSKVEKAVAMIKLD